MRRLSSNQSKNCNGDQRYEASLERSSYYCRACDRGACFSTAYRPRPVRKHRHRPGGHSSGRVWPVLSALQSAGGVARAARCRTFGDGPCVAAAVPTVKCGAACGLASITLNIKHCLIGRARTTPVCPASLSASQLTSSSSVPRHPARPSRRGSVAQPPAGYPREEIQQLRGKRVILIIELTEEQR